jgi:CRP-like cAMP-binding protein
MAPHEGERMRSRSPSFALSHNSSAGEIVAAAPERRISFADRVGRRLSFAVSGRGDPLFVPPPLSAAMLSWARVMSTLMRRHRVVSSIARGWDVSIHLRACSLFKSCTEREFSRIASVATVRHVPRYQVLYREAAIAASGCLIFLARGSVRLNGIDQYNRTVHAPSELSLRVHMANAVALSVESAALDAASHARRRPDTATTVTKCVLICIQPSELGHLVRDQCRIAANLRLMHERHSTLSVFRDLSDSDSRSIAGCFEFLFFQAGTVIVREGELSDRFYTLIHGTVAVSISTNDDGERGSVQREDLVTVAQESEYKHFGESGFMEWLTTGKVAGKRRSANVTAVMPCWCAAAPARAPRSRGRNRLRSNPSSR